MMAALPGLFVALLATRAGVLADRIGRKGMLVFAVSLYGSHKPPSICLAQCLAQDLHAVFFFVQSLGDESLLVGTKSA